MSEQDTRTAHQDADGQIISGHMYDGIEEYDNPMPPWWVWIFIVSIIWAPIYFLGVHQFGFINTYEDDLAAKQAELTTLREAAEAANPSVQVDDAWIASFFGNADAVASGAATFGAYCAACHGNAGEGLIGPNLTDAYWIHGAAPTDLFAVITNGVLDKGMTPWESVLTSEERAYVIAYIKTLEGTNPANAKEAQGEEVPGGIAVPAAEMEGEAGSEAEADATP